MASESTLKSYFETGDTPTQQQFAALIDSKVHGASFNTVAAMKGTSKSLDDGQLVLCFDDPQWGLLTYESGLSSFDGVTKYEASNLSGGFRRLWDGNVVEARWGGMMADGRTGPRNSAIPGDITNNSPILQNIVDNYEDVKILFPGARPHDSGDPNGYIEFESPVRVDVGKNLTFDGQEQARLLLQSGSLTGRGLIEYAHETSWTGKNNVIQNFAAITAGTEKDESNLSAIKAVHDGAKGYCRFDKLVIDNIETGSTTKNGYAIDLKEIAYSIAPEFRSIRSGGQSLRITPSQNADPSHSTSNAHIREWRAQFGDDTQGPCFFLAGMKQTTADTLIIEGDANIAEPSKFNGFAKNIYVRNPGPRPFKLEALWMENWGSYPSDQFGALQVETEVTGGPALPSTVFIEANNIGPCRLGVDEEGWVNVELSGSFQFDSQDYEVGEDSILYVRGSTRSELVSDDPNIQIEDVDASHANDKVFIKDATIDHEIYTYEGGLPYNSQTMKDGNLGADYAGLYVHHHPQFGSCFAVKQAPDDRFMIDVAVKESLTKNVLSEGNFHSLAAVIPPNKPNQGLSATPFYGGLPSTSNEKTVVRSNGLIVYRQWASPAGIENMTDGKLLYAPYNLQDGVDNPRWWVFVDYQFSIGTMPSLTMHGQHNSHEDISTRSPTGNAGAPPKGTYKPGDKIWRREPTSTSAGWMCVQKGTDRTIGGGSVTGDADGSTTISNVSDVQAVIPGDFITVGGASRRVLSVDVANNSFEVDSSVSSGTGLAISNDPPTLKEIQLA